MLPVRRRRVGALCTPALLLLLLSCASSDSAAPSESPPVAGAHPLEGEMERVRVPGLAVAWVRGCELDEVLTLGRANVETGVPVTSSTLFEGASLSKPVFALLFLRAVAEGHADLDASVASTLPSPRIRDLTAYEGVTPRTLLTHRSGLPNWAGNSRNVSRLDPLEFAFAPGEAFSYSGEGYFLLQRYLEEVTGEPLERAFQARLGPLMPSSSFGEPPEGTTPAYGHGSDGLASSGRAMNDAPPVAASSLKTVAADYGRFLSLLCHGGDLPESLLEEMFRPQSPVPVDHYGAEPDALDGGQLSWGLGWGVQLHEGRTVHFHWGDNGVFKAFVALDRKSRDGVVFFANGQNGLELIPAIVEPVVGSMRPVRAWLN